MGILDDAIKEHLDLKRRHGADPTEMERLEREALGPVRRGADGPEDLSQGADAEASPYDEPGSPEWSEAPLEEAQALPEPEPSFAEEPEPAFADEPEPAFADEPEVPPPSPYGTALFDHEASAEAPPAPTSEPLAAPEPPAEPLPPDPDAVAPPPAPDPTAAPAAPEPTLPPPEPPDHLEEETAEYDVEAEHTQERRVGQDRPEAEGHAAPPKSGEDVLEETPEFLQDTPDHDRLWFEQRPPRDFDFEE